MLGRVGLRALCFLSLWPRKPKNFYLIPITNSTTHPTSIIKWSPNQDITFPVFLKIWPKIDPNDFSTLFPARCVEVPVLFTPLLIANTMVAITPAIPMTNPEIPMKFLLTKSLYFSNATFGLLSISSRIASSVCVWTGLVFNNFVLSPLASNSVHYLNIS